MDKLGARCLAILIVSAFLFPAMRVWAADPLYMDVLTFDGRSGYVELPRNLFDNLSEGTIEVWVRWEKFNKWSRVFDFGREDNAVVIQNEKTHNTITFAIWDERGKRHRVQAKKIVRQGVWHHLAAVFGRSGMAFYIDGELIGTDGYEGGLQVVAGGRNYVGKSNWPKDKLFLGQMAELRVWNRRLSPPEIAHLKDRTLRGDEEGLLACWRLNEVDATRIPGTPSPGYAATAVGGVSVSAVPAISRFLVPGELEKTAGSRYVDAAAAFDQSDYETATGRFREVVEFVRDYKDAAEREAESQRLWNLAEAEKAYALGQTQAEAGDHIRAYWAFDRVLEKVANYKNAASLRQEALTKASYSVGLFVLSSEKVRGDLASKGEEPKGRWSRWMSALGRAAKTNLFDKKEKLAKTQDRLYAQLRDQIDKEAPPYLRFVRRAEMHELVANQGVNAGLAHADQVIEACRSADIPVVVVGELTTAYARSKRNTEEKKACTVKKVAYTDIDGKKKKREVAKKWYTYHRVKASSEMGCEMRYRIVNTATGETIDEGAVFTEDLDEVDFVNWNNYDGVSKSSLRRLDGSELKPLPHNELKVFDARSNLETEDELLNWGASKMGYDLSRTLLQSLTHYSPRLAQASE